MARRPTGKAAPSGAAANDAAPPPASADDTEEVTRCICGNEEFVSTPRTQAANANPGLFVQCEKCHVWQHGFCVGFLSEDDIPDEYYCEQCEPSFHNISMRHGILISRYRPVRRPGGSRSPRKSRPRDIDPVATSPASDGEEKRDASSSPAARARNGTVKPEPAPDAALNNINSRPHAVNGGSKRKSSSERLDAKTSRPASARSADSSSRNPEMKPPPRSGQRAGSRSLEDGTPGSSLRSSHEPELSHTPSPQQSREGSEGPAQDSDDATRSVKEEPSDLKAKRSRRKNSDDGLANSVRGRVKRRSREEEILQRVLEESAREARELEARRRGQENGEVGHTESHADATTNGEKTHEHHKSAPAHDANNEDLYGVGRESDSDEKRTKHTDPRHSGKRSSANDDAADGDNEDEDGELEDDDARNAGATEAEEPTRLRKSRPPRTPRARPGRKPGSKSQATPQQQQQQQQQRLADKHSAISRRTPNGVKKCRPRIPSPRSTFQEMRRRVATILEFSGRTQVEMAEEKQSRVEGPFEVALRDRDFQNQSAQLAKMGERNTMRLEELTRKLLSWEEQFGPK